MPDPLKLPADLYLGEVGGIAVNSKGHIFVLSRGNSVELYSRPGNDLTARFPLIVEALARLRSRSCIIDGEEVCGADGIALFERIRCRGSTAVSSYTPLTSSR